MYVFRRSMPYQKRFRDTLYNPSWLRRKYVDEKLSSTQIAELLTNRLW